MAKSIIILIVLGFSVLIGFQNCGSKKEFAQGEAILPSGTGDVPVCREVASPDVAPKLKWDWRTNLAKSRDNKFPNAFQVMSSAMVADLDGDLKPEVVFVSYSQVSTDAYSDAVAPSAYHRNGVLRIVDGATGENKLSVGSQELAPFASLSPLLADLDRDGKVEIIYIHYNATPYKLIALNYNGTLRWKYNLPVGTYPSATGLTASDVNGDGVLEVLAGTTLVTEERKVPKTLFTLPDITSIAAYSSITTALDPAKPGVMSIVTPAGIFDNKGKKLFNFDILTRGQYLAVADIYPEKKGLEIVTTGGGKFVIYNGLTGEKLKSPDLSLPKYNALKCSSGSVGGGPASIGDFDGDPATLEIAVATGRHLTIFDKNLEPKYSSVTQDCSSLATGLTSFDLNGDKKPEILYADEEYFRIYEIENGELKVRHEIVNPSGTLNEYPLVADIDGNGTAEIVLVANNYAVGGFYKDANEVGDAAEAINVSGVRAFESNADNAWMPTRPIWNQFNFHPDLVTNNGQMKYLAQIDKSIYRRNNQGYNLKLECK